MRPFILLFLLLFGAIMLPVANAGEGDDVDVRTYPSYAFGKTYTSIVKEDALMKCPAWLETAENPPVSVRKAMRLADAKRQQLVHDTKSCKWRRESVSLEFVDVEPSKRFYWHIHYQGHDSHALTGPGDELDLFVLMDGKVVEPIVSLPGKEPGN